MDESPTARALRCLEIVRDNPGITADRLAERLGVTARAARRYVAILREAGVDVESLRGPYGGYRVGRGLRLPPLVFSAAEALGLVMAALDGHHDVTDTGDAVGIAVGKLLKALPGPAAVQATALRDVAAAAPDRAAARPDPQTTTTLVHACADHRRVRLDYCSEAGSRWQTDVDPWGVVVRHGRWYLLCHVPAKDAQRAYRVDRVQRVETLADSFEPPPDLDPVGLLEDLLAVGWEYDVEVVFDAPLDQVRWRVARSLGRLEPLGDNRCRLIGSTGNPWWYAEQLATVSVPFRILGCPELRATARAVAMRLLSSVEEEPRGTT